MKVEEAHRILNNSPYAIESEAVFELEYFYEEKIDAIRIEGANAVEWILKLIDSQTPMKPVRPGYEWLCPKCGESLEPCADSFECVYLGRCDACGQVIDWSNDDD